jgi:hypothetical protein
MLPLLLHSCTIALQKTHEPTNAPLSLLSVAQQPNMDLGCLDVEVPRTHKHKRTDIDKPHSVRLL